jgi:hypothetical protein
MLPSVPSMPTGKPEDMPAPDAAGGWVASEVRLSGADDSSRCC